MKRISLLVSMIILMSQIPNIGAEESNIFFKEDFKHYKDVAPSCIENIGISLRNDPIWSRSASAVCDLSKDSYIFKKFAELNGTENVEVLFKFRFKDTDGKFDLVFRTRTS